MTDKELKQGYKPNVISTIVDINVPELNYPGYKPNVISTIVDGSMPS